MEQPTVLCRYCPFCNLDTIGKQNYQEPGIEAELNFEFFEFTICST